ncbi:MAG: hypothetical protein J6T60_08310 [Bacteroidales bacterium]|nr:hypothetical protein [Bacteroidales bacterium]
MEDIPKCLKFVVENKKNIIMECKDWNPLIERNVSPKILLIGHDPRLQNSDDKPDYALYANYYFRPEPECKREKNKYILAKNCFTQIIEITNKKYREDEIYVSNLCNIFFEERPKKKTILIPENVAKNGVIHLQNILQSYKTIEYIFSMSEQVNYWLQYFGFYNTKTDFLNNAKPKCKGICSNPPYYEASRRGSFREICGNVYETVTKHKIIPILHVKTFKRIERYYSANYDNIRLFFS